MPSLGLFLSSTSSTTSLIQYVAVAPLGFPLRIKLTSSDLGFTDNLFKIDDTIDYVGYEGSNSTLFFGKTNNFGQGEITLDGGSVSLGYPSWGAGATSLPRTGWEEGYVISEASPISVSITLSTPQTFTYNASIPSIVFSNNQSLASNLFSFSPVLSSSAGTRSTTLNLNNADYEASTSPSVTYTINKKNVTIALTSQSSTYAPNQTYSAVTPVAITSLSGSDTISASFGSLLTGMPATGANAGSYTISLNPSYTSTNYNITNSPASVTWTISKANQTITFNPTLTGTNGQTQSLSSSSTSGLSVTYSVVSGPATLAGSTLTYTGTGSVVVRASQAGDTNYNVATNVDKTIVVSSAGGGAGATIPLSQENITMTGFSYMSVYAIDSNYPFDLISRSITIPKTGGYWYSDNNVTGYGVVVQFTGGSWTIRILYSDPDINEYIASNPAPNTSLPSTGWVFSTNNDSSNSGSITITATT
jgi:hypothetical protein